MLTQTENKELNLVKTYMITGVTVVILMMVFGILMLLGQGGVIDLTPAQHYQFLTIHGTGMIGGAATLALALMWHFLNKIVPLSRTIFLWALLLIVFGFLMTIIGIFSFDYASSWVFLYPLPAISGGAWGVTGALLYLGGMLILGVGFLITYIDTGRAIIKKYGSLFKGLGWDVLFGKKDVKDSPPKTVIASTMVTIVNTIAILAGAIVLIMNIITTVNPSITFDPLLAKNLTFAFGHVFANATIYMAVIIVYAMLPKYAKRDWGISKLFILAWAMSTVFTLLVYTHHLLMDPAVPTWMQIMGQVLSYANGLPVLIVTAYGALTTVSRSGIKWEMPAKLALLAMFGWAVGVVPAIVDATITVNYVMHNTKWVPGHFHMYMGLGLMIMIFAFMYHLARDNSALKDNKWDKFGFYLYIVSIMTVSMQFLFAGAQGTPRRWASHFEQWMGPEVLGAVAGIALIIASLIFLTSFIRYLLAARKGSSKDEEKLA